MTIYLDLVFLINFFFDALLLMCVSIVLKRNTKIKRIGGSALVGSLTTFLLLFNISSITLFIFKILISILMIIIAFSYKNLKYFLNNIAYLYMISMILGGFLYYLNTEFSLSQVGLIFINEGLSINYIFLILFSPIVLIFYVKLSKQLRNNYSNYYKCQISFNNKKIDVTAFLDTGNKLKDPYFNKGIILLNKKYLKSSNNPIFIPFKTLNNNGLLKCFKGNKLIINNKVNTNFLIAESDDIMIDGIECIISEKIMEDLK